MGRNHKGHANKLTKHSVSRSNERLNLARASDLKKNLKYAIQNGVNFEVASKYYKYNETKNHELIKYITSSNLCKNYYLGNVYVFHKNQNARTYKLITIYPCKEKFKEEFDKIYTWRKNGK